MRNEKIQIKAQKQDKALQIYAGLRGMCEQNKDSNRTVRIKNASKPCFMHVSGTGLTRFTPFIHQLSKSLNMI